MAVSACVAGVKVSALQHIWFLQSKVVCGTEPGRGLKGDFPPQLRAAHPGWGFPPARLLGPHCSPLLRESRSLLPWSLHKALLLHLECSLPTRPTTSTSSRRLKTPHLQARATWEGVADHSERAQRLGYGSAVPTLSPDCTLPGHITAGISVL